MYHEFRTVITLTANERVKGSSQEQSNFRELQYCRELVMTTLQRMTGTLCFLDHQITKDITEFEQSAVKLYYKESVVKLNMEKLKKLNEPIPKTKARHANGAHKIHPDEFSGLEPVLKAI